MICENGNEETKELIKLLHERKWQLVVISLSASKQSQPVKVPRYYIDELNEVKIQSLIETITTQYGPIVSFIALGNRGNTLDVSALLAQPAEKRYVDFVFLMATQLKSMLVNGAMETRTWFVTTSSMDGKLGLSENVKTNGIVSGGLSALTKTLQREWPQVFCRAIDFSPELSSIEKSKLLVQELFDADRNIVEVGYFKNKRYTVAPLEIIEC